MVGFESRSDDSCDASPTCLFNIVLFRVWRQQWGGLSLTESRWIQLSQALSRRECSLCYTCLCICSSLQLSIAFCVTMVVTLLWMGRKSDIALCKNIFDERTPNITYRSFQRRKKAFSLWSLLHLPKDLLPKTILIQLRTVCIIPTEPRLYIWQLVGYGHDRNYYGEETSSPNTPRNLDEYNSSMLPAASAAAALAQLHNHKVESDWDSENVRDPSHLSNTFDC